MSTEAELFPGESILRFIQQSQHRKLFLRHGINITTNQRLFPTFRGNGNTIIVGDSETSPLPIFPKGGGTSVQRLIAPKCQQSKPILLRSRLCEYE